MKRRTPGTPDGDQSPAAARPARADVVVIGDGIIGLSTALAVARAGGTSCIIGHPVPGSASVASAGLLAPSVGPADRVARDVMTIARDQYPPLIRWLAERTGIDVPLNRRGIIELPSHDWDRTTGTSNHTGSAASLEPGVLRSLEPMLAAATGSVLHPLDGFVDNVRLLEAMREATRCEWGVDAVDGRAARIERGGKGWSVFTEDGRQHSATTVVIAAGAWSPLVAGVPRALRVEPVRGQMLQLGGNHLEHAVAGPDAYVLPRGDTTIVGSTLERVGFDYGVTEPAIARLRAAAITMVPALETAPIVGVWAGLRPMTPDGLPIIGTDPEVPSLIYACGHGKNGILLAPLTGECVAAMAAGRRPPVDISLFSVLRFG